VAQLERLDFNFWEELPVEVLKGSDLRQRKAEHVATIATMAPTVRKQYLDMVRRWYAEQDATRTSITSRAATLMLFVGVITTGATLVAANLQTGVDALRIALFVVGGLLLYACVAIAFGAVRAQGIARFTSPSLTPNEVVAAGRNLDIEEAAEYATAYEQNQPILANQAAYLKFGHLWARRAIILAVMLAILVVASAATKPPPSGAASAPVGTPSASALPAATPVPASPVPTATQPLLISPTVTPAPKPTSS
jgi:hypothetical protein